MNPTKAERTSETAPLRSVGRSNSIVAIHTTGKTVSTTFFLVLVLFQHSLKLRKYFIL